METLEPDVYKPIIMIIEQIIEKSKDCIGAFLISIFDIWGL